MAVAKITDMGGDPEEEPEDDDATPHDNDMRPVTLPTGTVHNIHKSEVDGFKMRMERYQQDNEFLNHSDLSDFDRLLVLEQLVLRWSNWLSLGVDYKNARVNEKQLHEQIKNLAAEVRNIKKSLLIDRDARNKLKSNDDVAAWIEALLFRAEHFGYKRNMEFAEVLEIFMELRAKIGLYERCDERDREEQKVRLDDIYEWLVEDCFPRLDEIDRKFRQDTPEGLSPLKTKALAGGQKVWIQEM